MRIMQDTKGPQSESLRCVSRKARAASAAANRLQAVAPWRQREASVMGMMTAICDQDYYTEMYCDLDNDERCPDCGKTHCICEPIDWDEDDESDEREHVAREEGEW